MVFIGMYVVNEYGSKPGLAADAPPLWPEETSIERGLGGYTLLMMVHPQCPCSRASLNELQNIMKKSRDNIQAVLLFYHPEEEEPNWSEVQLWSLAQDIPNTQLVKDWDGAETTNFGVFTSGQVLLYDEKGDLRFSGGITPSRGHVGDSAGKEAILQIMEVKNKPGVLPAIQSLVFGCSIQGRNFDCKEGYCHEA